MSLTIPSSTPAAPASAGDAAAVAKPPARAAAPGADVMQQLEDANEALTTLLTGVDNQATVQTQLQVQAGLQETRVLPELQAVLNKQYREAQQAMIAKV